MNNLQDKIAYAATVHTAQVATALIELGTTTSRAVMLHDDGLRVIHGSEQGFIILVQAYITRFRPRAYTLILDATFISDQQGETPCILCATVRDDGKARTLQTPYSRTKAGIELGDEVLVPLDEGFLRYYDNPIDFSQYSSALSEAVDAVSSRPLDPFLDFFVVQS